MVVYTVTGEECQKIDGEQMVGDILKGMRRWLFYLTVFSVFFWLASYSLTFLVSPWDEAGRAEWGLVVGFLMAVGGAVFFSCSLLLSSLLSLRQQHKLPPLLVKGTFFHSGLVAVGVVGFLVIRLLGGGNLFQIALWCIILLSVAWIAGHKATTESGR